MMAVMALTATQTRILDTAAELFRERGVAMTRMEQIAARVGLARPNLYRHFASKEQLVLQLLLRETRQSHQDRAAQFSLSGTIDAVILRGMELGQQVARNNPYIGLLLASDAVEFTAAIVRGDSDLIELQTEFWGPVLAYGRSRGEIRDDLDDPEIIRWLTTLQFLMVDRPDWFGGADGIHRLLSIFVIPAFMRVAPESLDSSKQQ